MKPNNTHWRIVNASDIQACKVSLRVKLDVFSLFYVDFVFLLFRVHHLLFIVLYHGAAVVHGKEVCVPKLFRAKIWESC